MIGNANPEFGDAVLRCRQDQIVLDLVRVPIAFERLAADYRGICW